MYKSSSHRWLTACLGIALLGALPTAHAAVGARVLLQEWSPLTPKQQGLRVLVNDASLVSDQVQKAWIGARPVVCAQVVKAMADSVAAKGQQLRDVKCLLDESPAFSMASSGANALSAALTIGGYVEATTTTPGPIGSYGDPRFALVLKVHLLLTVAVQPNPDQILRIDKAAFTLSDATIDSHNLPADAIKFIAEDLSPFFKGANFKQFAEAVIKSQSIDVARRFDAVLAPINARLRGPSAAVRVAVWGRPDAIIVAFGPRKLPVPGGGTVFGALRWDASKIAAPGGCGSFAIAATVQTGPAPLRDPGGYYEPGDAPTQTIGEFQLQPGGTGECRYRMTELAAGWPNEFQARSSIGAKQATGNSLYRVNYALSGDGWDGHTVVPQPRAERNYLVHGAISGSAVIDPAVAAKQRVLSPGGPVVNPLASKAAVALAPSEGSVAAPNKSKKAALLATPSALNKAAVQSPQATTTQRANAAALNPQPLPPATSDAVLQAPSPLR